MIELTPWFSAARHSPVREGRYNVRLCAGWRIVPADWRGGAWFLPGSRLDRPEVLNNSRWPGMLWRGRACAYHAQSPAVKAQDVAHRSDNKPLACTRHFTPK